MYESKVIVANSKLELPHSFDERSGFYIADGSSKLKALEAFAFKRGNRAYLNNTEIWFFARIVDRDF